MHRFVHPQPFGVGPVENRVALAGHLARPEQGREFHERRLRGRLGAPEHGRERDPHPWNHHRPCLDAAVTVDSFFELERLDQILDVVIRGLGAVSVDLHRPGAGVELSRVPRRIALVAAELVEVVVVRDLLERVELLVGRHDVLCDLERRLVA